MTFTWRGITRESRPLLPSEIQTASTVRLPVPAHVAHAIRVIARRRNLTQYQALEMVIGELDA